MNLYHTTAVEPPLQPTTSIATSDSLKPTSPFSENFQNETRQHLTGKRRGDSRESTWYRDCSSCKSVSIVSHRASAASRSADAACAMAWSCLFCSAKRERLTCACTAQPYQSGEPLLLVVLAVAMPCCFGIKGEALARANETNEVSHISFIPNY
jgi:hypothetical protein